jgi:hypothetical protein
MDLADLFGQAFDNAGEWAPYALQAGGTIARMRGDSQVRSRQQQYMQAEMERQRQLQAAADAANAQALQRFTPQAQQQTQQTHAAALEQKFQPSGSVTEAEYAGQNPGAPAEVKDSIAKRIYDGIQKGKAYAKSTAALGGFTSAGLDNQFALNRNAQTQGQIGKQSGASTGVLPFELNGAYTAGKGAYTAANAANGLGDLANLFNVLNKRPVRA